jgi:hypothetical protein
LSTQATLLTVCRYITQDYEAAAAPPDITYYALGHTNPQAISSAGITERYAGSPLQLDFGEEGEAKSVVLIEATPGSPTRVETIALRSGCRLMTFTGELQRLAEQADDIGDTFVKTVIEVDGPGLGLGLSVGCGRSPRERSSSNSTSVCLVGRTCPSWTRTATSPPNLS